MLQKLRNLIRPAPAATENGPDPAHLACVCLLIRAARIDGAHTDVESATVRDLARTLTGLTDDALDALVTRAEEDEHNASDLFRWTRPINIALTAEGKIRLIEALWQVAASDGGIHDYEANLLRRIAGLIYVPDRESGAARQRVLARQSGAGNTPA